jgi:transposase
MGSTEMNARQEKGRQISALSRVSRKDGVWHVPSQSGGETYIVDPNPDGPRCTCPDYELRGGKCKHIFAVEYTIERETQPDGNTTVTETVTVKATRVTYKQDWPAYNAAQINEKAKFQALLHDLCRGITEPPPRAGAGRKPIPLADMVFSVACKVFSTVSGRRFSCDLAEAHAKGYLSRLPHYNTVFSYLENPTLVPILRGLIIESSLPLKAIETDFAVDSSGFSTSRFVRWYDQKYGRVVKKHDWVKVHIMTGVKTNIVTAVEIKDKDANDSPLLPPLVNTTKQGFAIRDVSADKAYIGQENLETIANAGGTGYIAFKKNATGGIGGLYEKAYHYFCLNRDEFLKHYHLRSNAESTFSMIKAKFGDSIRSKTDVAMVNESLCKILCHNLACVISAMYELNINPVFWGDDARAGAKPADTAPDLDEMMSMLSWI